MSEWTGTHDSDPGEQEITDDEKREIIASARSKMLPSSQLLDRFGSTMTKFIQPGRLITVHVPALFRSIPEVAPLHHSVQIIEHVPEELEDNITMVHITSYTIHELELTTEYYKGEELFNTTTLERLRPRALTDADKLVEAHELEHQLQIITAITHNHLPALRDLLASLSLDQVGE